MLTGPPTFASPRGRVHRYELHAEELHLAACRAAKPDPEELAARLFAWELSSEWDVFHGVAETHADVPVRRGWRRTGSWPKPNGQRCRR